ncbi:MAG: trypsin-like peptidase domain-containing protein [Sulfuritalea sp.]|nr:trypsin-like peptidase domain-containing protein [Sulfuritalea sp.]
MIRGWRGAPQWLCVRLAGALLGLILATHEVRAGLPEVVARIKPSVVVVGTFNKLRSPAFRLRGTGFVVGDGLTIATNAHVLPAPGDAEAQESLTVLVREGASLRQRQARIESIDKDHDLALLKLSGTPLPPLTLKASETVREGQEIAFTGFPIGGALGYSPVSHRGLISAITPIVLPGGNVRELNEQSLRRLRSGSFPVFQLDATAYPGNSGGPMYDAETGEVLGIVNMVFVKSTKEAVLQHPSGISYAIPADYLIELLGRSRP